MKERNWSIDSLVLIFSIIVLAQILVYLVPQGQFERVPFAGEGSHLVVVEGTYTAATDETRISTPPWQFLLSITKGFSQAQGIIFLIFIAGGVIKVLRHTGAIDAVLFRAVSALDKSPGVLIAGTMALFGIGSFTIGMGEEYVPLIPLIVTMCLAMRMDAVVAMAIVWVPYGIGWGCAGFNPFNVVIAQDIANVPIMSGWELRFLMMIAFMVLAFHHIYRYAQSVIADPNKSMVSHIDYSEGFDLPEDSAMTSTRAAVLLVFAGGIAFFVYGAQKYGWYIAELNAVFMGIALIAALICRMPAGETSRTFMKGAAEMTTAALLVGFARTIAVVLQDGQVIDTIINSTANVLLEFGAGASAVGMLIVQSICNFFIPSGSGQAYVTMPIMSPIASLTGVPQQSAVLAFQFGDGFSNMIVPTSALVIGALAFGRVPYGVWFRFVGPLLLKIMLLAAVFLVGTLYIGDFLGFHAM